MSEYYPYNIVFLDELFCFASSMSLFLLKCVCFSALQEQTLNLL